MKIELLGLSKKYGSVEALKDFNASFDKGIYGLLGPNGAGKSTLLNGIVGLLHLDKGEILFDGKNIREVGEKYLDSVGFMPQSPKFYENFTVYEFMFYMATLKNLKKDKVKNKILSLLDFVNLSDEVNKKAGALSGGMRQRLGIAQALLNDPKFLILDEPTAGLDPKERIRFRNLISQISADRTVLLATHIVSDISLVANQIILLDKGKKLVQDSPESLIKSMTGKVWEVEISADSLEKHLTTYQISNARFVQNSYTLRIVSDKKPDIDGVKATIPSLEDLYLSYFGENSAL